jgi:hypothetical protein
MSQEGGCACGAIRYRIEGDPMASANCYCRDCQRASGGSPNHVILTPKPAFAVTKGEPKWYRSKGDSGGDVARAFCADCGSPLFSEPAGAPFMVVKVGSLDDPSAFAANLAIWTASAQPWHHIPPGIPAFPQQPPQAG